MKFFEIFLIIIFIGLIHTFIDYYFGIYVGLVLLIFVSIIFGYLATFRFAKLNKLLQERDLFIDSPIVIFKWNPKDLTVEYVSENIYENLGFLSKDFILNRESFLNYIHHEDIYRVLNELNYYTSNKFTNFTITPYRLVTKSKDTKWVLSYIKILRDKNEKIINYFGYIVDVTKEKENENRLEKLSKIVEYTGDSVVMTDINGLITYVNPAFEKQSLYKKDEVMGMKLNFMKSDLLSNDFYEKLWQTILNGDIFRDVFINKKKNGELFYEEKTIAPIKNERGVITSFVSTAKDITNRILKEKELEDIFNLSVSPIAITDLDTNFLRVNPAYEKMSGYTKEELKNLSCVKLSKEDEIDEVKKTLKIVLKNGFIYDMKKSCISKDKREIPINLSMTLLPNQKELLLIATDISKEINEQQALKHQVEIELQKRMQNEQKYQYLFNSGNDAIFIHNFDENGLPDKFIEANDVACKMFGYTKEELKNLSPKDIAKDYSKEPIDKLLINKENIFEREFITKNKRVIIGEVNAKVFMLNDKPTIFASLRDITSKKEQEKFLIEQSKMATMGELLANIAHQWRQPLNAVGLIVQKITLANKKGKLTNELVEDSTKKAMDLLNKLSSTIDNFRDFFKPKNEKELFLIADSINEALKIIEVTLSNYDIKIKLNLKDNLKLTGFSNEFAQVIINLLNNSKDAILIKQKNELNYEGLIEINLYEKENFINIEIVDNGGGIEDNFINKVFEPYVSTKENFGRGIGLYMSKIIIEDNMKGKIIAENILKDSKKIGLKVTIKFLLNS